MDEKFEIAVREVIRATRFFDLVGLKLEEVRTGYAKISLPCEDHVKQIHGQVHGGALATLADTAVALALSSLLTKNQKTTTVEMKINYLEPVRDGKAIAEARIIRKGKRIAVGEVDIWDEKGQLAAKSLVTYMILEE